MITFEKASESYKSAICSWFEKPHVQKFFYGDGLKNTLDNLDLYCQGIRDNGAYCFDQWVGLYQGRPFAFFISSEILGPFDEAHDYKRWYLAGKKTYTLDVLIGEEAYLGKGLATGMIRQFIQTVLADGDVILIDPELSNSIAIHVYQKVGFRKVAEFVPDFNPRPHIMMRLNSTELEALN